MSRIKRVLSWCAILTAFGAFSVVLLGGMAGVGTAATVSDAVSQLADSGTADGESGAFVTVRADGVQGFFDGVLGRKSAEVCWVTNEQLATIASKWQTSVSELLGYRVATVYAPGVGVDVMRSYVSGTKNCVPVRTKSLFFLPLESGVS